MPPHGGAIATVLNMNLLPISIVLAWALCAALFAAYAASVAREITYVTLADGKKGAYLVGTRLAGRPIITHFEDTPDERGRTYLAVTKGAKYCGVLPEKLIFNGHTDTLTDSLALFYIPDLACGKAECVEIAPPYEAEGDRGIWSVADAANCGDAYLDGDGKLHVFYTTYHFDFNDAERRENPALVAKTLKHMQISSSLRL